MRSYAMPITSGTPSSRRLLIALSALVVILMIGGALSFMRYAERNAPNPRLVAVSPFDIFVANPAPELARWRVELAEALTIALAVPPLETVPQERVRERWKSAPTSEIAAVELARRTSAATAVYGRIDPVDGGGSDSLIARVIVADAATSRVLFAVVLRWPPSDLAGLARAIAERIRANHPAARSE
jgi:hypothetical protein